MKADVLKPFEVKLLWLASAAIIVAAMTFMAINGSATESESSLSIDKHQLMVEVADTEEQHIIGLAYRRELPEDHGMLFVFPKTALYGMWMRGTNIPLSVAFLDEQGIIINMEEMEPHSLFIHYASKPAKYALEVNRGWFDKRDVKTGLSVKGIEQLLPAK